MFVTIQGDTCKVRELFRMIVDDQLVPTPQSYFYLLECLGRNSPTKNNLHSIRQSIKYLESSVSV